MTISLSILLLVFGGLTFWLLTESSLKWYTKTACIASFCAFTLLFWSTLSSFLGYPANSDDMPEIVTVHWAIIKEPNKHTKFRGQIYFLIESSEKSKVNPVVKFFGYGDRREPRLFGVPYSRKLHEQIEGSLMPRLRQGQPVTGKLSNLGTKGTENKMKGKSSHGSESQGQVWEFHELPPSALQPKPGR